MGGKSVHCNEEDVNRQNSSMEYVVWNEKNVVGRTVDKK